MVLIPITLLCGQPKMISDERLDEDNPEVRRHQRCISKCTETAWKRWER